MNAPLLLPVAPGTLNKRDWAALTKAGITVIEHPFPDTLRLLAPTTTLHGNDMLSCALDALTSIGFAEVGKSQTTAGRQRDQFVSALAKIMAANSPPAKKA